MATRNPIKEMCQSKCEIIPIEETTPQKTRYADYVKRATYRRIYEGTPSDLRLVKPEFDTLEIAFASVGNPLYHEIYLKELPSYTPLPPYTFPQSQGILTGLRINTEYEIDLVAFYVSNESFSLNRKRIFKTLNESPPANMIITTPSGLIRHTEPLYFDLSFTDASGSVLRYEVDIFTLDTFLPSDTSIPSDTPKVTHVVYPNQINAIPNLDANQLYRIHLLSLYQEGVYNPDYIVSDTRQMIHETPISNLVFFNTTGYKTDLSFHRSEGNSNDISYSVLLNDQVMYTFDTSDTIIELSFNNLEFNREYDVKIISTYATNQNSYLVQRSFQSLQESEITHVEITSTTFDASASFIHSPNIQENDFYRFSLYQENSLIGNSPVTLPYNVSLPLYFSSIVGTSLDRATTYNMMIETVYFVSNNVYTQSVEFQTLNEGVIEYVASEELLRSGVSAGFIVRPFQNGTPIEYEFRFVSSSASDIIVTKSFTDVYVDANIQSTIDDPVYFFNNIFQKDTVYSVYITVRYDTGNIFSSGSSDISFQTRNEEGIQVSNAVMIYPYGTYISFQFSYLLDSNISTNFDYEIVNLTTNTADVTGSFDVVLDSENNHTASVNTYDTFGHALIYNISYRFRMTSKYGSPTRPYITFRDFQTLNEYPLYLTPSSNFTITGRKFTLNINDTLDKLREDLVSYNISLSNHETSYNNINQNIFPIEFTNLYPFSDYIVTIESTFPSRSYSYDISYAFRTLNESELAQIVFPPFDATNYNPYPERLIETLYVNPGYRFMRANLLDPSGSITSLTISVEITLTYQVILDEVTYPNNVQTTIPNTLTLDGLEPDTDYTIFASTAYATGNEYTMSQNFRTKNEKEIDIEHDFFIYTTNDTLAIDFVETGSSGIDTYILEISGNGVDLSYTQIHPPLDFDISNLTVGLTYNAVFKSRYINQNTYISNPFVIIPGFTSEHYIRNGTFFGNYIAVTDNDGNSRGFSFNVPVEWNTSDKVVIGLTGDEEDTPIFYKVRHPSSNGTHCAIIYLPSNINNPMVLRQPIKMNRGPNNDPNDNNMYTGEYIVSFFVANHQEVGEVFTFGNTVEGDITYNVRLVDTSPSETTIESRQFTNSSVEYIPNTFLIEIPTSYNDVEFQIQRIQTERNNLFVMDIQIVSIETSTYHYYVTLHSDPFLHPYYQFENAANGTIGTPTLYEGMTYTFTRNDNGHPFHIGNAYNINTSGIVITSTGTGASVNGVNAIVSGESLTFTIPFHYNSIDSGTLMYFCTTHSQMQNTFTIASHLS